MNEIKPEKFFIYISLIVGLLFVFIIPPMQSPDENSHFKRAYTISKLDFYPKQVNSIIGFTIENDILDFVEDSQNSLSTLDDKYNFSKLYYSQFLERNYRGETFVTFSTVQTTPFAYTFSSLGIIFSKIFSKIIYKISAPPLFMLLFARLFNLIGYILITYFAIKKTPKFKKSMCFIALLPMCLFLAATVSYDVLLIPLSFLYFSIFLNIVYNDNIKKINVKHFFLLLLIGFIFLNVKTVYISLYSLMFFIPKEKINIKYKNKKAIYLCLLILSIFILTFINKIPTLFLNSSNTTNDIVNKQINWVISHPINASKIVLSNMYNQFGYQLSSIIGKFGLLDTNLPGVIVFIVACSLFLVTISDASKEKIKINYKLKITLFISVFISIVLIYSVHYVLWSPANLNKYGSSLTDIIGVQGRYFLPLLFAFILLFSNKLICKNKYIDRACTIVLNNSYLLSIISITSSFIIILLRFWI